MAATIQQIIEARLAFYGIAADAVTLEGLLTDNDLDGGVAYGKAHTQPVKTVLVSLLSDLLAKPDVTEGDLSIKYDRGAVKAYVEQLKGELGISKGATVTNKSYLW